MTDSFFKHREYTVGSFFKEGRALLFVYTLLYKNIFYRNIEAEICEILRIF